MSRTRHAGLRPATHVTCLAAAVAALVSLVGLLWRGVYQDPERFIRSGWVGNDLVVLLLLAPALVLSAHSAGRGSPAGILVWLGVLDATLYNAAFYLFGAAMNRLLLGYITVFALSLLAILMGLTALDVHAYRDRLGRGARRFVVGYMSAWALLLGLLWSLQAARLAVTGEVPDLNGSERAFQVTAALDLSLVVPFVVLAVVLLLRRHPWAVPVAVLLNVKGVLYPVVLIASSVTAHLAGVEGSLALVPLWCAFLLASGTALILLLRPGGAAA